MAKKNSVFCGYVHGISSADQASLWLFALFERTRVIKGHPTDLRRETAAVHRGCRVHDRRFKYVLYVMYVIRYVCVLWGFVSYMHTYSRGIYCSLTCASSLLGSVWKRLIWLPDRSQVTHAVHKHRSAYNNTYILLSVVGFVTSMASPMRNDSLELTVASKRGFCATSKAACSRQTK